MRRKLTEAELSCLRDNPKSVICHETGEMFKNSRRAAIAMNLSPQAVNACVRHTRASAGGYTFDYLELLKRRRF